MRVNRDIVRNCLETGAPLRLAADRAVGRTTILALRYVAQAIEQCGQPVEIRDHWGTHMADVALTDQCGDIVQALGLRGFEINASRRTVRCTFAEQL